MLCEIQLDAYQKWYVYCHMPRSLIQQTERDAFSIKRVLSEKLNIQIKRREISKAALARKLGTSRSAVDRVLDPKNTSITLRTLVRVANNLGYKINLTMEPRIDKFERFPTPPTLEPLMRRLGSALDKLPLHKVYAVSKGAKLITVPLNTPDKEIARKRLRGI